MKILFDNKVKSAILSSTAESLNYPAANLAHVFLRKRYQSTAVSDVITVTFDNVYDVDCFFWGYLNNVDSMVVEFFDIYDTLLSTLTVTLPDASDSRHFTKLEDVAKIVVTISGVIGMFIGGIGAGEAYTMPDPLAEWSEEVLDNSSLAESPVGQSMQNYMEPMDSHAYNFDGLTRDTFEEIRALVKSVGLGMPIWIDAFEENHDFMAPIYAKIIEFGSPEKSGMRYGFTLTLQEAR